MSRKPRTPVWSTPEEQFFSKWEAGDGCWLWTGTQRRSRKEDPSSAYGVMKIGGRGGPVVRAHRFAWEYWEGPIADGLSVLHKCDNPLCVNPDHLFLGTNQDNMTDKQLKGRAAKKLTPEAAAAIRSEAGSQREIAKRYGITHTMVGYIKRGHSWSHIQEST